MYQERVRHLLSPATPGESLEVDDAMWKLFLAVGEFWKLTDRTANYRLRFRAFMANRININPLYQEFYRCAKKLVEGLIAKHGSSQAYEILFTDKDHKVSAPAPPETELEFVQLYVINEFIALRLALGGFKDFGGVNYCGYFGGANIADEPVPYRPEGTDP